MEIKRSDELFPESLRNIYNCPKSVYGVGNLDLLKSRKKLAIVGSRGISLYGKEVIGLLIPDLIKNDFCIVSGMAFGVDAEVHRVCLQNHGKTIAVLASGTNVISPKGNEYIYKNIINNQGLIVSEYPDNTKPQKQFFVDRNRIISGISLGVLVIEGGDKSGTLITAKLALEQGREVMAVPGKINDKNSFTPNYLIKNGAYIIRSSKDILEIFDSV